MTWRRFHSESTGRFCSSCQQTLPIRGGEYIAFNGGRNRRWICEDCKEKRDERRNQLLGGEIGETFV